MRPPSDNRLRELDHEIGRFIFGKLLENGLEPLLKKLEYDLDNPEIFQEMLRWMSAQSDFIGRMSRETMVALIVTGVGKLDDIESKDYQEVIELCVAFLDGMDYLVDKFTDSIIKGMPGGNKPDDLENFFFGESNDE